MTYKEEIKWLKDKVDGHDVDLNQLSENINTLMRVVASQELRLRTFEQKNLGHMNGESE